MHTLSRRDFVRCSTMLAVGWPLVEHCHAAESPAKPWPLCFFSKACQPLRLSFDETAAVAADAGLQGIDCPVRPGGQVLPERVKDDLPALVEALKKHGVQLSLITTAIASRATPHTEDILRTARALGVKYYRLTWWDYNQGQAPAQRWNEIKAQLKDLAALNRELGLCGTLQNHAGQGRVGAKVGDLMEIAGAFDSADIAIAFDIGHALHELGGDWQREFDKFGRHLGVIYVKDWSSRAKRFVELGAGDTATSGFLPALKRTGYDRMINLHIEYPTTKEGAPESQASLTQALRRDREVWQQWVKSP